MASFSQRQGYKELRSLVQQDDLDSETRMAIWNTLAPMQEIFDEYQREMYVRSDTTESGVMLDLWTRDFLRPRDEMKSSAYIWGLVKQRILAHEWNEAMDVVESVVKYTGKHKTDRTESLQSAVINALNKCFESHLVGYRLIGQEITPIDSTVEAEAVASAIEVASTIGGARYHLERATELLADRQAPDYPNSIKEAISAVEAIVKKITGEGTLGAGLGKLEAAGLKVHPALKSAWSKMYGWTSDEGGIRHAGIDAASADQALAKYALVTCSAFVSYLIEEGRKVGLI